MYPEACFRKGWVAGGVTSPPSTPSSQWFRRSQKRCLLSRLTNSALVYDPKCGGPMSTAVHMGPKINFGDLTPYLTYAVYISFKDGVTFILLLYVSFMTY